jgi:hypothetical protein
MSPAPGRSSTEWRTPAFAAAGYRSVWLAMLRREASRFFGLVDAKTQSPEPRMVSADVTL